MAEFQNGGSPSHHGFQYKAMVIHDLDDFGGTPMDWTPPYGKANKQSDY